MVEFYRQIPKNACLVAKYFETALNKDVSVDWEHINKKKSKRVIDGMSKSLEFVEFNQAVENLTWCKTPEIKSISLNALKALDDDNRWVLQNFLKTLMEVEDVKYEDYMKSRLVSLRLE